MNRHSVPRTDIVSIKENPIEKREFSAGQNLPSQGQGTKCSEETINLSSARPERDEMDQNDIKQLAGETRKNNGQSLLLLNNKILRKGSLTSECSSSTELMETPKHKIILSGSLRLQTASNYITGVCSRSDNFVFC